MITFRQNFLLGLVVAGAGIANGGENLFEGKGSDHIDLSSKMSTHETEDNKIIYEPIDYYYEFGCDIGKKVFDGLDPISSAYQIVQKGFDDIKGFAANGLYYLSAPLRVNLDHLKGVDL